VAGLDVVVDGLTFAEGPRWREGKLWFSDFYSHRVLTVDAAGRVETVIEVPGRPSGLGFTPDGALLVVSMLDRSVLRVEGGRARLLADLSGVATGPCNDMVVDAAGRAYVGNFGFDRHQGESERTACIARVDPDGRVTRVAEDLHFPNGTVITPDGRTLIVAETLAHRLTAFDIDATRGLARRRVLAEIEGCFPDGICLDAEGAVWVADARSPRVVRVRDGRVERTIATGDRFAFACMLGGDDRRTLFVVTNTGSGPAMADRRDGRIESVRVDVPGAGLP
jgi:sugar lactone lactonase YvrE